MLGQVIANSDEIQPQDLTIIDAAKTELKIHEANNNASQMVGRTVESVEKELIIDTLNHCLGNRTHAANILGISIRTLRNKLKIYGETME
jgi:two-component system, response regulator FlrC